jgi:hypothetical protein
MARDQKLCDFASGRRYAMARSPEQERLAHLKSSGEWNSLPSAYWGEPADWLRAAEQPIRETTLFGDIWRKRLHEPAAS